MKVKVSIPETIQDITLGTYQKYVTLSKLHEEIGDVEFLKRKLTLFTGLKFSQITKKDFDEIIIAIDLALNKDTKFQSRITLNGVEFGLIPNLDKIQSKEYFDLSTYDNQIETMHNTMAILFRPIKDTGIGNTYTITKYKGTERYAETMKQLPYNFVVGATDFFLNLHNELQEAILRYTILERAKGAQLQTTS